MCVRERVPSSLIWFFFLHSVMKFHPPPPPLFLQPPPPKRGKENYVSHPCQFLLFVGVLGIFLLQLPLMTWFFFIKHGQQRQKWLRLIKIKSKKGWERELFLEAHQNTRYAWIHAYIQCSEALYFNYISLTSLFTRYALHMNLLVVDSQALFIYHRLLGLWMIQMRRI